MNTEVEGVITETLQIVKFYVHQGLVSEQECLEIAEKYMGLSIDAAELRSEYAEATKD